MFIQYEIFCKAKVKAVSGELSFDEEFKQGFHNVHNKLDDKAALFISAAFVTRNCIADLDQNLRKLPTRLNNDSLSIKEAIALCRNYNIFQVFKIIEPLAKPLLAEEESKRYIVVDSVLIN